VETEPCRGLVTVVRSGPVSFLDLERDIGTYALRWRFPFQIAAAPVVRSRFLKFCYDVCNQFIYLDLMINIDVSSLDICDKDQKKHDDAKSISLKKHDGFYTGSGPLKK
jgi:hypothetical protein